MMEHGLDQLLSTVIRPCPVSTTIDRELSSQKSLDAFLAAAKRFSLMCDWYEQ